MVQSASLFSQLLHEVPRHEFARLVNTHQGERHAKGFTCWAQFTAMLFCQLAHTDSLREICNGLACCVGKLVHLGITRGPSKSSLSYANVHRPAAIFEDLFWSMTHRFRARSQLGARTHAFRFKNKRVYPGFPTLFWGLSGFFVNDLMGKACGARGKRAAFSKVRWARSVRPRRRQLPQGPSVCDKIAASSDCSRPVNDYVHIEAADLRRPNARFTTERQGYQVLTPFGKLGYSRTNCCRSIRPPSVCASVCFPGPRSAAPRAASRPTSCWTTTITCPPTC